MTLTPLLDAPLVIQVHVAAALPTLVLGPFALFRDRRDRMHKTLGYAWVTAMGALAVSGLFIPSFGVAVVGMFGPIHLLSLYTLAALAEGIRRIRHRDIEGHKRTMQRLWFGALGLAGLFTLVPGRLMHEVLIGGSAAGWAAIGLGLAGLALLSRKDIGPGRSRSR